MWCVREHAGTDMLSPGTGAADAGERSFGDVE